MVLSNFKEVIIFKKYNFSCNSYNNLFCVLSVLFIFIILPLVTFLDLLISDGRLKYEDLEHEKPVYEKPTCDEPKYKNKKTIKHQALNLKL